MYGQLFNFVRSVLYDDLSAIIYVLQMGRNELKYDFNCQNHAFFREYIFQFFINIALPASNIVDRQNFMGKSVKDD